VDGEPSKRSPLNLVVLAALSLEPCDDRLALGIVVRGDFLDSTHRMQKPISHCHERWITAVV
jgi:hypothetical protein